MFDILYSKLSLIEDDNKRYLNEIEVAEKNCSSFMVECQEHNGYWGIWLTIGDDKLLVNPNELVSSIYKYERHYLFDSPKEEVKAKKIPGRFFVDIRKNHHVFEWQLGNTAINKVSRREFSFDEYLSKITNSIKQLHKIWSEGRQIAYKEFDVSVENVDVCLKQLQMKHTLPSHYRLMAKDVITEPFHFSPKDDEWREKYLIGIGNRSYETWLTHWDSDYEKIRHQLENILYEEEATIRLPFDTSETIIKLKEASVLDEINQVGDGVGFKYKEFMAVEIEPNEFVHMPIIFGYCDRKETVRTFYEGLLRLAMAHPDNNEMLDDHVMNKIVAYNKFKSPIIESYLKGEYSKDDEYSIRQVHVKHILRIDPDYDAIMWDEEGVAWSDLDDLYDKEGNPIDMPELIEWQKEIEPIVIDSETGHPYEKDWADYHRRGLEMAHQLREKLSTDFDLWYDAPFEDKSGTITKSMLIL